MRTRALGPRSATRRVGLTTLFEDATVADGRVISFFENFPTGTTYRQALKKVLEYLPSDVAVGRLTIQHLGGSCGIVAVTSPALARSLMNTDVRDPAGVIAAEFSYTYPGQQTEFNARNVETALISLTPIPSEDGCLGIDQSP